MINKLTFEIIMLSTTVSSDLALNIFEVILYIKIKNQPSPYFSHRDIKRDNIEQRTPWYPQVLEKKFFALCILWCLLNMLSIPKTIQENYE